MSVIRWPEPFNEKGRLAEGEAARLMGKSALAGEPSGCPQTLLGYVPNGTASGIFAMKTLILHRLVALFVTGLLLSMVGCSDANESNPGDVSGYNYTDYYIARFRVANEGQDLWAGGPNIFPKQQGEQRSGGGKFMCCIGIPSHWRSGMKLVVKWRRDTHPYDDDRSGDQWLTATAAVPQYDPRTAGLVVHFLPGDRIRVQVRNKGRFLERIGDHDPYIAQGVLDPELNKNKENAQ
ncbi:DUF3304 domain-containing protein [Burkholderia sp. LMG 21824]|uniref:DUF3304 domain-containing protein n=1 Tax=Burkholderia sp. LMG 21824 TaxID=3158172 RepID=UPI003C30033F